MRRVRATALIGASAQNVWDLYADAKVSERWVPFVDEILWVRGPAGKGQVYRERTKLLGIRDEAEWEIVEWDPPRRQVQLSTAKGMDSRLVIDVEPASDGARVRQAVILESRLPPPLNWIHELVFAVVGGIGIRGAVRAARRTLEADATAAGDGAS